MLLQSLKRNTIKFRCEQELKAIQHTNDGLLRPKDVVKFAHDHPESALNSQFEWDVERAAEAHWLEQARRVIRVHVEVSESIAEPIRVFVSLQDDRVDRGGGYRLTTTVMNDRQRRALLLHQALKELKVWKEKYRAISELAEIFGVLDETSEPEKAA